MSLLISGLWITLDCQLLISEMEFYLCILYNIHHVENLSKTHEFLFLFNVPGSVYMTYKP